MFKKGLGGKVLRGQACMEASLQEKAWGCPQEVQAPKVAQPHWWLSPLGKSQDRQALGGLTWGGGSQRVPNKPSHGF